MERAAILDFGTNTFNLLIAARDGSSFNTLYSGKQPVKLGKGGINNRTITREAMERGLTAIGKHMETIREYSAETIIAYATSAFRNAENGTEFAEEIRQKFGFTTNIIDGEEEARLIYEGIRASVPMGPEFAVILDIGGGSNEFIICNEEGIHWKYSFDLGMARIIEKFDLSDPILTAETSKLETYFEEELALLTEKMEQYNPRKLIGASGSFDTIAALADDRFGIAGNAQSARAIPLEQYGKIHRLLLDSTGEERRVMPGMEPVRIEMIVPATIFINFVINHYGITSLTQSNYALKEGAAADLFRKANPTDLNPARTAPE